MRPSLLLFIVLQLRLVLTSQEVLQEVHEEVHQEVHQEVLQEPPAEPTRGTKDWEVPNRVQNRSPRGTKSRISGEDDHRAPSGEDHAQRSEDHAQRNEDHAQRSEDHARRGQDHARGGVDHGWRGEDHTRRGVDHGWRGEDHTRRGVDHGWRGRDHARGGEDHLRSRAAARTQRAAAANSSSERPPGPLDPLHPLADGSHWAYAVVLLAFLLFAAGMVGNLALMCIVWHNVYLKTTWNCVVAGLALWDFAVIFSCLPVVVFHELTAKRLLGDLSCRLVPYLEVTSLGIATFSLCALSVDRFNAAVAPARPSPKPRVEPCQSIVSKLSIIWVGSMLLAAPELLLWKLLRETVTPPSAPAYMRQPQLGGTLVATLRTRPEAIEVDLCVREPPEELSDGVYSLVLTYHEARAWWFFGCYVCLPLVFSLACDLLTRRLLAQRAPRGDRSGTAGIGCPSPAKKKKKKETASARERGLRSTVMALAALQACCGAPESACTLALRYASGYAGADLLEPVLPALGLLGQLLLFLRCALTPLLMLLLRRSLGRAFADCCCCCCGECGPGPDPDLDPPPSLSASTTGTSASPSPTSVSPPGRVQLKTAAASRALAREGPPGGFGTPC